jgi:hypothetical protein
MQLTDDAMLSVRSQFWRTPRSNPPGREKALEPGSPLFFTGRRGWATMNVIAEQEHSLLLSDAGRFAVVERRAGKFYPLCNGIRGGR